MERLTSEQFKQRYGNNAALKLESVSARRFDKSPTPKGSFLSDIGEDIGGIKTGAQEAFAGGKETANEARQQVSGGEISPLAGTVKTIGGGIRAGAEALGSAVTGILKTPFSQSQEDSISGVVEDGEGDLRMRTRKPVLRRPKAGVRQQSDPGLFALGICGVSERLAVLSGTADPART